MKNHGLWVTGRMFKKELLLPLDIEQSILHQDIEKYGKLRVYSKGEMLFTPEEMRSIFFFVLDGRIKVSQVDLASGKEQTLKILTHGDMYDVVTLLDNKLHDNLLHALDEVTIIVFPMEVVKRWMHEDPDFNKLLFPYIAKQFRDIEELALDLSFYDTATRLLKLISKNIDHQDQSRLGLLHDLSHEEIASLIGTVRKVLNRHIQTLKSEGIIDVEHKNIKLKDTQKLLDQLPLT
ncbi:Crp/Fnr family transcriptional regulator [Sulfurovum sp.]|uniref:Crp/Fnr family transcriptional regulator n=1 Tax=Sulfurovum sp. TaxID=1969726 RepID=UPI002F940CCC